MDGEGLLRSSSILCPAREIERAMKLAVPKVPIASRILPSVPSPLSGLAGLSVCSPWNPWQSAFCSHPVLQVRRFALIQKCRIWEVILLIYFN